jgi:MFS family permease
VDTLSSPSYKGTVHEVWLIGTAILGQIGSSAILYGLATVLAASLAGPTRPAYRLRSWLAPELNEHPGTVAAVVGSLYLLLILWGPTHALRMWWGILLFAALIAAGLYDLRKQTLLEFPQIEHKPEPALAPAAAATGAVNTPIPEQIAHLAALHDSGALSDVEYTRAKDLVLSG